MPKQLPRWKSHQPRFQKSITPKLKIKGVKVGNKPITLMRKKDFRTAK
jgi:hypothetical protein